MRFTIAIEPGSESTAFGVVVPDLPGCFSAGDTIEEVARNAREAIEAHCAALADGGGDLAKTRPMSEWQQDPQFSGWTWDEIEVSVEKYFWQ